MTPSAGWSELTAASPELADKGRELLYQRSAIASAFLATVAPDRGPRVHPVFPALALGDLWLFIVNLSPKYRDLRRNGRYALHTLPTPEGGEEFYLRGHALEVDDAEVKRRVSSAANGQGSAEFEGVFRCTLHYVLYTRWDGWGSAQAWPHYTKWRPDASESPTA